MPSAQEDSKSAPGRLDRVCLSLGLMTLVVVGWTAWLRFSPRSRPEPPAVGQALPPLRLLDLKTSEPMILLGSKGKVTWLVFWSANSPSESTGLARLEAVWTRLKWHRRLTMVAAAINLPEPIQRISSCRGKNQPIDAQALVACLPPG